MMNIASFLISDSDRALRSPTRGISLTFGKMARRPLLLLLLAIVWSSCVSQSQSVPVALIGDWYGATGTKDLVLLADGTGKLRAGHEWGHFRWVYNLALRVLTIDPPDGDALAPGEEPSLVSLELIFDNRKMELSGYPERDGNWLLTKKENSSRFEVRQK